MYSFFGGLLLVCMGRTRRRKEKKKKKPPILCPSPSPSLSSHFISIHLISLHLISSHLISSHFIAYGVGTKGTSALTRVSARVQRGNLVGAEHGEAGAADIVAAVDVEQRVALVGHGLDAVLVQEGAVHLEVALVGELHVLEARLLGRRALERLDLADAAGPLDLALIVEGGAAKDADPVLFICGCVSQTATVSLYGPFFYFFLFFFSFVSRAEDIFFRGQEGE